MTRRSYAAHLVAEKAPDGPWFEVAIVTVTTDVHRVRWSPEVPDQVTVSGHVYDVETGLITTVIDTGTTGP
ncbi:MAG TPA: hypothetical protein VGH89_18115 [Pseudonocardia sp.]